MSDQSPLQKRYATDEARRVFEQERLILEVADAILEEMERRGLTKAGLAERLETSRAHITQVLSGSRNMTLRTLADISWALDMRLDVNLEEVDKNLDFTPIDLPRPRVLPRGSVVTNTKSGDGFLRITGEWSTSDDVCCAA